MITFVCDTKQHTFIFMRTYAKSINYTRIFTIRISKVFYLGITYCFHFTLYCSPGGFFKIFFSFYGICCFRFYLWHSECGKERTICCFYNLMKYEHQNIQSNRNINSNVPAFELFLFFFYFQITKNTSSSLA